jgi:2-polyprenyl-3-methyl-5-hydroxy-6-metoxy-1,4-benzoquinol methylase
MTQPPRREPYRAQNWKIIRFRAFAASILGRFPPLKRLAAHLYDNLTILMYQWRVKRSSKRLMRGSGSELDIDKIYWVNPARISYASLKEFSIYKDKGKTIEGDWDKLEKRFEHLDVYIAFKERFVEGKDWEDTIFYQGVLHEISNGGLLWGCQNKSDLDRRCENLDALFQNIKNTGYKSRSEMLSLEEVHNPMQIEDEIAVNVGRHGDLLFNNGAHRFSVVKLLGIQRIPVKITVRHPQWVNFVSQILLFAKNRPAGKIYQPITHPDLQYLPASYDSESDEFNRFNMICKALSIEGGSLLDIGANWGYFCHKFEEIGFDCYAVENERLNVYFLEKLKRAENRHFKIIDIEKLSFNVVLALNIFHHFLKDRTYYFKLIELLGKLKLKEMYFQPHHPGESQMIGAYQNYSEEEFVKFILEASRLTKAEFIGATGDGRKIYKLH